MGKGQQSRRKAGENVRKTYYRTQLFDHVPFIARLLGLMGNYKICFQSITITLSPLPPLPPKKIVGLESLLVLNTSSDLRCISLTLHYCPHLWVAQAHSVENCSNTDLNVG